MVVIKVISNGDSYIIFKDVYVILIVISMSVSLKMVKVKLVKYVIEKVIYNINGYKFMIFYDLIFSWIKVDK